MGNLVKQKNVRGIQMNPGCSSASSIFQAIRCMSSSKLFVGGIAYATDDQTLREAFSVFGEVTEAKVILDRETGRRRSRGFGFVSFASEEQASKAISMDGKDLHGRRIRVNYAIDRAGVGGYGGGSRGYGDGNSYGGNNVGGCDESYNSGGADGSYVNGGAYAGGMTSVAGDTAASIDSGSGGGFGDSGNFASGGGLGDNSNVGGVAAEAYDQGPPVEDSFTGNSDEPATDEYIEKKV